MSHERPPRHAARVRRPMQAPDRRALLVWGATLSVAILSGLIALLGTARASTTTARLTWSATTLNTDGSAAQITGYRIWRKGPKDPAFVAIATLGTLTAYLDANPPPGIVQYAISAIGLVKDSAGKLVSAESVLSNPVTKKIRLPAPTGGRILPAPSGGVLLPPKQ